MSIFDFEKKYDDLKGKLPKWLRDEIPPFETHYGLLYAEDTELVEENDGYVILTPDGELYGFYPEVGVELDDEVNSIERSGSYIHSAGSLEDNCLSLIYQREEEGGLYSLILPSSMISYLDTLVSSMEKSVEAAEEYEKNPDDFCLAYQFIDSHMSMWTNMMLDDDRKGSIYKIISWDTEGFVNSSLHIGVFKDIPGFDYENEYPSKESIYKFGVNTVCLEGGEHITRKEEDENSNAFQATFYNPDLRSCAPTFEEAIISYAKKLNKNFDKCGNSR